MIKSRIYAQISVLIGKSRAWTYISCLLAGREWRTSLYSICFLPSMSLRILCYHHHIICALGLLQNFWPYIQTHTPLPCQMHECKNLLSRFREIACSRYRVFNPCTMIISMQKRVARFKKFNTRQCNISNVGVSDKKSGRSRNRLGFQHLSKIATFISRSRKGWLAFQTLSKTATLVVNKRKRCRLAFQTLSKTATIVFGRRRGTRLDFQVFFEWVAVFSYGSWQSQLGFQTLSLPSAIFCIGWS